VSVKIRVAALAKNFGVFSSTPRAVEQAMCSVEMGFSMNRNLHCTFSLNR
jgi:hypothetical protein